jgi:hypothetical protein
MNPASDGRKQELAQLIEKILDREEMYWNQRSWANWLQNGDKYTTYFHSYASARKTIFYKEIKRSEWDLCGRYFSSESSHCQLFTNLFSTEVDVTYPDFLAKIDQKVTVAMNERLMAPFLG